MLGQPMLARRGHRSERARGTASGAATYAPTLTSWIACCSAGPVGALDDRRRSGPPRGRPGRRPASGSSTHRGEDRQVRALEPVPGEQPEQRLRAQQGGVGVGDEDLGDVGQQVPQAQQRRGCRCPAARPARRRSGRRPAVAHGSRCRRARRPRRSGWGPRPRGRWPAPVCTTVESPSGSGQQRSRVGPLRRPARPLPRTAVAGVRLRPGTVVSDGSIGPSRVSP